MNEARAPPYDRCAVESVPACPQYRLALPGPMAERSAQRCRVPHALSTWDRRGSWPGGIALIGALLGPGALPGPALGIDVTSCGQQVPSGERGDLLANLSCDVGVHLGPGAALNLNGFTLTGNGALSSQGVQCLNRRGTRCTINGPGEIRGFGAGVSCAGVRLEVRDVVLRFNRNGISCKAPRRIELSRVGATDNEVGIDVKGGEDPCAGTTSR